MLQFLIKFEIVYIFSFNQAFYIHISNYKFCSNYSALGMKTRRCTCAPSLVGVASLVSEILLLLKFGQISLSDHGLQSMVVKKFNRLESAHSLSLCLSPFIQQVNDFPSFREPMKKREWTFSKFVDEYRSHEGRTDEYIYYQDALTDTVGSGIKHDFVHFNWQWVNERKKRYNWGQLTSNLLLISQPGNITPCHYDEQHNFFCQVKK